MKRVNRRRFLAGVLAVLLSVVLAPRPAIAGESRPFRGEMLISPIDLSTLPAIHAYGEGIAAHMGRVRYEQHHTVLASGPPVPGDTFPTVDGRFRFTAMNGDTIFGSHIGSVTFLPGGESIIRGLQIIEGGTGRFEGATGVFIMEGVQGIDLSARVSFDGTIYLSRKSKNDRAGSTVIDRHRG